MRYLRNLPLKNKRLLLRTDYDVPLKDGKVADDSRIKASLPTLTFLLKHQVSRITILCHLGRPGGKIVESLRVRPVKQLLIALLPHGSPVKIEENLRFNSGEEANDQRFAAELAKKGDVFINDAFAVSHRAHASIVSLPKLLPSAIGLQVEKEVGALSKVRENPRRPLVFVIGGAKLETKLPVIKKVASFADEILVGGKLAQEIKSANLPKTAARIMVARLTSEGKDITADSAAEFAQRINNAGTVVWNGPMGVYEEEENSQGTRIIAEAVNSTPGYTLIGGGDTEAAATKFAAEDRIDHISMGGGAMLQYLADGTLVGLEAIKGGR